jgi:phosphohistidine swiveling domain-containing protein
MSKQWIYPFHSPPAGEPATRKKLLGGKGAGLSGMLSAGFTVPPGFTLTTEACRHWYDNNHQWPEGLEDQLRKAVKDLETATGRTFGRGKQPLLVSVRSGAAVSMPGMMDTLLNCGLHAGLADELDNPEDFWKRYTEFILAFADTVYAIPEHKWPAAEGDPESVARARLEQFHNLTGKAFPAEPMDALRACINAVFASWNSERANAYRTHHGLTTLTGTAVNVQVMWPSQVSGIAFTQDPNDVHADRLVIEAAFGLGEAVVSGEVTPDLFHIDRASRDITRSDIGFKRDVCPALGNPPVTDPEAPSLSPEQLRELTDICLRLEEWTGYPLDIEWGLVDGKFALLQSRPIQGLEAAREVEPLRQREIVRLRSLAGKTRRIWVTHNLDETLRFPTPLTWDVVSHFMSGAGGFGLLYQNLGYRPSADVCTRGFLERIGGRIYADPERLAGLFFDGLPMRYDLDAVLKDRTVMDAAPSLFDPSQSDERFLTTLPRNLAALRRTAKNMKSGRKNAFTRYNEHVLPEYLAWIERTRAHSLDKLDDGELFQELEHRRIRVLNQFAPESLLPGFFGGVAYGSVLQRLTSLMGAEEGGNLTRILTSGLDNDTTIEQDQLLHRVAEGHAAKDAFLRKYGHRCVGEMELSKPRWREDSTYIDQSIERIQSRHGDDPETIHDRQRQRRIEAQLALPETLKHWGGLSFLESIQADLHDAQILLPCRESGKHALMMGYELIRNVLEIFARRWELGGDLYYLTLSELPRFQREKHELLKRIHERKVERQACQRLDMPEIIDSTDLDSLGLEPDYGDDADVLTATAVAPGIGTGTAHIVFDPSEAGDMPDDAVLVCPSTDPAWTPLFMRAKALIVERGGVLSHGAIVARNLGIPAVVCPGATKRIDPGARVRVDGQKGTIRKLNEEEVPS